MSSSLRTARWSRRFVFVGACWLVAWQVLVVAGVGQRSWVIPAVLGFVFHTVFGKAYSLVPSYFDRELSTTRLLPLQFVTAVGGTAVLLAGVELSRDSLRTVGGCLWAVSVVLFAGPIGWSISDNITGSETGTGESKDERRSLDRFANFFVPVAFAYLLAGSWELLAVSSQLPPMFDGYPPRAVHLLAAGAGALLVFSIGFRLLPRFFATTVPEGLAWIVLPAGALAPAILATTLPGGDGFVYGAVLQATAVSGYALAVFVLFVRSDRRRVGFYSVVAGGICGILAASVGLLFALDGVTAARLASHVRLNLLGLLGLTIVGVSYQFYPPAVGSFPVAGDRTAGAVIALLFGGVLLEVGGQLFAIDPLVRGGQLAALLGAVLHLWLLSGLFYERSQ